MGLGFGVVWGFGFGFRDKGTWRCIGTVEQLPCMVRGPKEKGSEPAGFKSCAGMGLSEGDLSTPN